MSWLEKFGVGSSKAQPNPPASNQPSAHPAGDTTANNNPDGNNPTPNGNNQTASPPPAPKDPLAIFSKMYDNATNVDAPPAFALDDAQLTEVASTQNFTNGIDKDLLAKAQAGDSTSLLEIINLTGRNAYKAALAHGSKLTGTFVDAREQHNAKGFGKKIRGELVAHEFGDTPSFENPVVRKQLIKTAEDLQRQYPDASPGEIKKMALEYITELAGAINPKPASAKPDKNAPTNFDEWLDS